MTTPGKPTLNFEEEGTGREITMAFGYMTDEHIPTMAVFVEDIDDPILVPKDVLQIALEQGWEKGERLMECGCEGHNYEFTISAPVSKKYMLDDISKHIFNQYYPDVYMGMIMERCDHGDVPDCEGCEDTKEA